LRWNAVFLTVLHLVSGSDRACEHWRGDYRIEGISEPSSITFIA
jgi:hypothetical protein